MLVSHLIKQLQRAMGEDPKVAQAEVQFSDQTDLVDTVVEKKVNGNYILLLIEDDYSSEEPCQDCQDYDELCPECEEKVKPIPPF